jgi:hypothetical protein
MDVVTAGGRASARLLEEKDALARAVTDALYAERPGLLARYGAVGRQRCLEDLRYTLEHLSPAVDLGQPAMFADYVRWLDGLLRARAVDTAEVVRSLQLLDALLGERLPADEAAAVQPALRAGLAALPASPAPPAPPDGGAA